jgi:hypothetical protein
MRPIIPPLGQNTRGAEVANLQDGLFLLLNKQVIHVSDIDRQSFLDGLRRERGEQNYSDITAKLVSLVQRQVQLPISGEVDAPTADALNNLLRNSGAFDVPAAPGQECVIRGQVVSAGGPVNGVEINVFDRDIGEVRQRLGDPARRYVTDTEGRFEIAYTAEQFEKGDVGVADLVFALNSNGQQFEKFQIQRLPDGQEITGKTSVQDFDLILGIEARPIEEVQIVIEGNGVLRGISEFEQLMQALSPALLEKSPADLDEQKFGDVTFVARETGVETEKIKFLVAAFKLARDPFANAIQPAVFYGLARIKSITDLAGLARTSVADLRAALAQAGGLNEHPEENIIPPFVSENNLNQIADQIHQIATEHILTTPLAEGMPTTAQLLSTALPLADQQVKLVRAFANHEGSIPEFWSALRQDAEFQDQGKVDKVQFALQLGLLTQNNLPVMNAIQSSVQFQSTRDMAKLETTKLADFIKQVPIDLPNDWPGDTKEEKIDLYTNSIAGLLQAAFPTETVAQVVSNIADIHLNNVAPTAVAQFLTRATDTTVVLVGEEFDIRSTHIDTFIDKYSAKVFAGVATVDQKNIVEQVKRTQRLFQVSSSPETLQVLMESKLNSANDIAQMSPTAFKEEFENQLGGAAETELIHNRAMAATAASLHVALQVYQSANDVHPAVVGNGLKAIPNWAQLFGSLELCECEDCRSVYSPAAYFVDLLQFLSKSSRNEQGWTPLDVLVGNYEDPNPALQLSGIRPDLPHIKLTCENTNTPLPYIDLVNEVLESYVAFGKLDQSTAKDTGESTAAELSANPQYIEDKAYKILQDAVYPPSLPYDRSIEVARVCLDNLGASRYEVMQAFAKNDAEKLTSASEYLGLSAKSFEVLTGKDINGNPSSITLNSLYGFDDVALTPTLQLNSQGIAVVLLQAKLNTDGANPPLTLSGVFDNTTGIAVQSFQQRHGIAQTGIVDGASWAILTTIKPDAVGALVTGVPEFLRRTELSYVELVELLKTKFVNQSQRALVELDSAKITYQEVRDLIKNNFANPDSTLQQKMTDAGLSLNDLAQLIQEHLRTIVLYSENSQCDLSQTYIQYLDGSSLDDKDSWKIQRFIRLWSKLGWSTQELDAALFSLGYSEDISGDCLLKLAQIKELQLDLNLSVVKLLSLWANINAYGDKSLYSSLFQNKAVLNPPDQDFTLNTLQDELADQTKELAGKQSVLLAALKVRAQDLQAIIDDAKLPNGKLTLANLSALYRYAVLAKALRLAVKDLIALKELAGDPVNPFTEKNPGPTLEFIRLAQKVKQSGFLVQTLDYIYRHQFTLPTSLTPQPAVVNTLLGTLAAGLANIAADNIPQTDPNGDLTRTKLGLLFDSATVDAIVQLIDGIAVYSTRLDTLPAGIAFPDSVKNKIQYQSKTLRFTGAMTDKEQNDLLALSPDISYLGAIGNLHQQPRDLLKRKELTEFLDATIAVAELLNKPSLSPDGKPILLDQAGSATVDPAKAATTAIAAKYAFFLQNLLPYLQDTLSRSLVKQTLSQAFSLDNEAARLLLENAKILHADQKVNQPVINDFLALLNLAANQALPPETMASYQRLHKIGMLVNTFKLSPLELEYWYSSDFAGLQLNALPIAAIDRPTLFGQWEQLADYVLLRNSVPVGVVSPIDVFKADDAKKPDTLAALTGWTLSEIEEAKSALSLLNGDLTAVSRLLWLQQVISLSQRLGVAVGQLQTWGMNPPDSGQATNIKNATKAKYDEEAWLAVSRPLSDRLRESQKAALIAYVLSMPEIIKANVMNSDQLFEYFLIDVGMTATMVTSRIKQAISSGQLFVQRCMLNLQEGVHPSAINAERWQWMKNYRVWEANRKVFLYPENWIEPELRDDKSPFFQELESELLQNDVTNEAAEKALSNYLYKLDQVARLEICGMYLQEDFVPGEEFDSMLHVFGRTMGGAARSYYYRRLIDNKIWTPWEKVELDIHGLQGSDEALSSGIHLLPVVWNRRLYLFWLIFTDKKKIPVHNKVIDPLHKIPTPPPQKYWEITLAWSKYDQNKWTPKQVAGEPLHFELEGAPVGTALPPPGSFRLRALVSEDGLGLDLPVHFSHGSVFEEILSTLHFDDFHSELTYVSNPGQGIGNEIRPENYSPSFMADQGDNKLAEKIDVTSSVTILNRSPQYTLLSLRQYYPWPLNAPCFYQNGEHVYFARSRGGVEIVSQIETPEKVRPPIHDKYLNSQKYGSLREFAQPAGDPSMEKTVINPWVSAERQIAVQRLTAITAQSGVML